MALHSGFVILFALSLLIQGMMAFLQHHAPPPWQRQRAVGGALAHPRKKMSTARLASSNGLEGDDNASTTDEHDDDDARNVKPKPFLTRRMRRGPIGTSSSSSSSSSSSNNNNNNNEKASASNVSASTSTPAVLKVSKKWACVANCGACCYLAPAERPFLMDYFEDPEDLAQYNSMVGDDGWCVHYDKTKRACTVFEDRPWFCRVEGQTFERMYGVTAPEMDKFCTSCCREQIADVYGTTSTEMTAFNTAIKHLKAAASATDESTTKGFGKKATSSSSSKAKEGVAAGVVPIDPFTGEASDKPAAKADWV